MIPSIVADLKEDLARLPSLVASLLAGDGWLGPPLGLATVVLTVALMLIPLISRHRQVTSLGRVGTPPRKSRLRRLSSMGGSLQ